MCFDDGFLSKYYFHGLVFLDVQREEKSVHKAIREAAKRNDMGSANVIFKFYCFFPDGSIFNLLLKLFFFFLGIYIYIRSGTLEIMNCHDDLRFVRRIKDSYV